MRIFLGYPEAPIREWMHDQKVNKTVVTYTQESGLPQWGAVIKGTLASSSIPNRANIETVTIGGSVTAIGADAFKDCLSLTTIIIPDSVTNIGERAFYHCTSLINVRLPSISSSNIGADAFNKNTSTTDVAFKFAYGSGNVRTIFDDSNILGSISWNNGVVDVYLYTNVHQTDYAQILFNFNTSNNKWYREHGPE